MITITMEKDGRKYELVPSNDSCDSCAFGRSSSCGYWESVGKWNDYDLCAVLGGIWKEVK